MDFLQDPLYHECMLETIILLIVFVCGFAVFFWALNKKITELNNKKSDETMLEWIKSTQQDMKSLQQSLNDTMLRSNQHLSSTLQSQTKDIHDRLTKAAEVIGELKREAGAFQEIGKSMQELQQFLKSPKLRGNIGEQVLNDLISQMFPKNSFHIQYKFKSGQTVDAAIKTDAGILPIDSKFPMENYQKMMKLETEKEREVARKEFIRDVKKHIDAISSKYILPEEGTMDFALMYVPSETVFYEINGEIALVEYARKARVYIVSPSTLYAHLQMILLSFEGKKIESKTREVFTMLRAVQKDYEKLDGQLGTLGRHLTNAYNNMSGVQTAFMSLGQKIVTTQHIGDSAEEEQELLKE